METKKCKKCGQELPISEFDLDKRGKDGHRRFCKACNEAMKKSVHVNIIPNVISRNSDGNPKLKEFKPLDLISELRVRGYRGKLTFSREVTV